MSVPFSVKLPELEGMANLTTLDIQIKKLRDQALWMIREHAQRMVQEASDIRETLGTIEGWLDKLKQLAEEVPETSETSRILKSIIN